MYDSIGTAQEVARGGTTAPRARWLLFIHHLPPKPDYFRVKVRRRLQRIGALALKNSVYLLPHTDEAMEDLQWLRRMVVDEGGEAMLCAASFIDGLNDGEVESMFREQSDAEFTEIIETVRVALPRAAEADVRRIQRQLDQTRGRDFFGAARLADAERAVRELSDRVAADDGPATATSEPTASGIPRGATWVTREGVYVDRIASAWLIRRFIDRRARFKYVPATGYEPDRGEIRFDMFEGEFTHEGDQCTFEVLAARFAPDDPALGAIAEIVHDVDLKDEKFARDEAVGIATLIRGITASHEDDEARVDAGMAVFDGLYASFGRAPR